MEKKIKILAFMNTFSSDVSGGDVRVVEILKRSKNVDIIMVASEQGIELCKDNGIIADFVSTSDHKISSNVIFSYFKRSFSAVRLIRKDRTMLKNVDVLYGASDFFPDVIPIFLLKNKDACYVQVIHHIIDKPSKRNGKLSVNIVAYLSQRISLYLIKMRSDIVITVSPFVRSKLLEMGFDEGRVSVNPNGIDQQFFKSVAHVTSKYKASFLGRLKESKGIFDLVRIWRKVCDAIPDAKLAMIGSGDENTIAELNKKITDCGLEDNIRLFGHLEKESAFQIICSSDIFVSPSHEEGFGIAILEAMACGVPVIAWDLPVYRDIFQKGMITVEINDLNAFSREVLALIDDREKRSRMGSEAMDMSLRMDWGKISDKELDIIRQTLSDRRS